MTKYTAIIDVRYQRFVIEDERGKIVAVRLMPTDMSPNPGEEVLMSKPDNAEAWRLVQVLVDLGPGDRQGPYVC